MLQRRHTIKTTKLKKMKCINDFQIVAKIGAGTFGVIIRAIDKQIKKDFALKIIKKKKIESKEHAL